MDLVEQKSLRDGEKIIEIKKCCTDCKTTKTPLWRGGPAGPKSLCNACGIRYRKKRRAMLGLHKCSDKKKETTHMGNHQINTSTTASTADNATAASATTTTTSGDELSESLKMRLMVVGKKMMLERSSSIVKKQRCQRRRRLLREEEQAAFSLMALSCGSVFA